MPGLTYLYMNSKNWELTDWQAYVLIGLVGLMVVLVIAMIVILVKTNKK